MVIETASPAARRRPWWWRVMKIVLVGYLGIACMLVAFETALVYPAPRFPEGNWDPDFPYEEVNFRSADGTRLHGWLLLQENPERWILYCHGNGEHVPYAAESMRAVSQRMRANVLVFDYRGYGKSDGRPHEAGVVADGEAALQWLCQRAQRTPDQVVLYGRSLGGAVAIALAARHGAQSLIVERSFTRMTDVAAYHYPWLPVRWLMRNRYPSLEWIRQYHGPLLASHGTQDRVIPFANGQELFDNAPSRHKEFVTLDGYGHNDPNPPHYWEAFQRFLQ